MNKTLMKMNKEQAKEALDALVKISRVHMYKPIQIAEILYHQRMHGDLDISDVESYRNRSKLWRDEMSIHLLGRKCTSSAKFQDNLFESNAIPPKVLCCLNEENIAKKGAVESYIYDCFLNRYNQLSQALSYCKNSNSETFDVKCFIDSFWKEPGLKRSIDKIYEIVVYSLFATLVDAMNLQVEVYVDESSYPLLTEFEGFAQKVMCIDTKKSNHVQDAMVYRVGVTNAADRGLDMYSNWGPAIQVKHLSLDIELAQEIVTSISSDKIVIVCKDAEKDIIVSLLTQIGWRKNIQSIVTENDLIDWYEKALRGRFSDKTANILLNKLIEEITLEFPSINDVPQILTDRHYENISDEFWKHKL